MPGRIELSTLRDMLAAGEADPVTPPTAKAWLEPAAVGLLPMAVGLAVLCWGLRGRLRARRERRLRASYDQAVLLSRIITRIQHLEDLSAIIAGVCEELATAIQTKSLHAVLRRRGASDLVVGFSSSRGSIERVPADFVLLSLMQQRGTAQQVPFSPPAVLPDSEQALLERLGVRLIVPILDRERQLLGLLMLGAKRSGEPWGEQDLQFLRLVAGNIVLVYEDVRPEPWRDASSTSGAPEDEDRHLAECPACGRCYDGSARTCQQDGGQLDRILPIERTLGGRYRLDRHLGRGSMGAVYQAMDLELGRPVAIKIMVGADFGGRAAQRRFQREARATARLNHPNIVSVYDAGRSGEQCAYIVMELVRGNTLRSVLFERHRLSSAETAAIFDQILVAVRAAHAAGIIHRDLKPENILILEGSEPRRVKVLDFGLAKLLQPDAGDASAITPAGMVAGTTAYAAPEQLVGDPVDARSDIYSLGVMVIEALTGERAHRNFWQILNTTWRLPGAAPEHAALEEVLQRCIAADPQMRFATVQEMQKALIPLLLRCPPLGEGKTG